MNLEFDWIGLNVSYKLTTINYMWWWIIILPIIKSFSLIFPWGYYLWIRYENENIFYTILHLSLLSSYHRSGAGVVFSSSNLPISNIDTPSRAIPNALKIEATIGIIYYGPGVRNYLTDPFNHYNGQIGIEIRGSSTQMFPKKQYGIQN